MRITPRSVFRRIRRPKPCLSFITASGSEYSMKELPPFFSISSILAFMTGSEGTLKGRRQMIRTERCR